MGSLAKENQARGLGFRLARKPIEIAVFLRF